MTLLLVDQLLLLLYHLLFVLIVFCHRHRLSLYLDLHVAGYYCYILSQLDNDVYINNYNKNGLGQLLIILKFKSS